MVAIFLWTLIIIIIIIIPRQRLWCCHHAWSIARVHPGSRDECRTAPGIADLWIKPIGLNHKPACRLPVKYTHHRHFIITQPESWYLFYHPTEGRRLSRPSWLATYGDGFTRSHTVTHPSTNRARRRVTSLIATNALSLSHATNTLVSCCFISVTFYGKTHFHFSVNSIVLWWDMFTKY